MPKIRQYADQYRKEDFVRAVGHRQVELKLSDRELAEAAGIAHTTFWRRMKDPDQLTVGELIRLIRASGLGPGAALGLLGYKDKEILRFEELQKE